MVAVFHRREGARHVEVTHEGTAAVRGRSRWPGDDRIRHRRRGHPRNAGRRCLGLEQRSRLAAPVAGDAALGGAMTGHHDDAGLATLETTLMVVILVPLLFGVIEFGWLFQRWLAADTVAAHAARYAGELGGDDALLR